METIPTTFDLAKVEIFDRTTAKKYYPVNSPRLTVDSKNLRFHLNRKAAQLLIVEQEKYIRFFRLKRTWFLSITDSAEGYSLQSNRSGANINARIVVNQMLGKERQSLAFYLQPTEHELGGNIVYELLPVTTPSK